MVPLYEISSITKTIQTENIAVIEKKWGKGEWRMTANGYEAFWGPFQFSLFGELYSNHLN